MSDTSLLFSILARSNLSRVLAREGAACSPRTRG